MPHWIKYYKNYWIALVIVCSVLSFFLQMDTPVHSVPYIPELIVGVITTLTINFFISAIFFGIAKLFVRKLSFLAFMRLYLAIAIVTAALYIIAHFKARGLG
jgi:hypothetical protein